ncbi:Probable chromosome-partitioning protein parB [Cutibacterium granulosum]|uniref:ParB-like N-terminal domain-containing protein n=2 Tax=Cutibacterium granulosum TaxID=33011 RepID=A0A9X5LTC9_9ACTN|nr:ParB/RepB/Spo0J family partition protein [Cutibacterium granulosum]KAG9059135.1 ParB/RepB/Spo0J family partition protein [Cutibacterium granulosum DSM 20700]SNV30448.1 Probable chromosome-partitioning protein parB [Cutibacterium granulosum]
MAQKHQGLGRGFGEFFQRTDITESPSEKHDRDLEDPHEKHDHKTGDGKFTDGTSLKMVELTLIRPNRNQPRTHFDDKALDELAKSIKQVGLLQPIVVTQTDDGEYELVMGERRWRAAQRAGLPEIPALVRHTDTQDMLRDALLENLHRVQLNPLEEAAAYQQMMDDFRCTQDEVARRVQRSRSYIANTIRLMKLAPGAQSLLLEGSLSSGHARALLSLPGQEQESLAQQIVAEDLSVRQTEEAVKLALTPTSDTAEGPEQKSRPQPSIDTQAQEESTKLSNTYGTKVKIRRKAGRGTISLSFRDDDEFAHLLELLNR